MDTHRKISLNDKKIFHELNFLGEDPELIRAVKECVKAQKEASKDALKTTFKPQARASYEVSGEALMKIIANGKTINGIRTEAEISNVIVFNDKRYENAVFSEKVSLARKRFDQLLGRRIQDLFEEGSRLEIRSSGFFLYPPGGYMGWHTNWQNPGWRLYVNYAEKPGKSFFRYRDPETHEIVTSPDRELNFRLFRVSSGKPFWHTVYSDTFRYSLGYKISRIPGFFKRFRRRLTVILRPKAEGSDGKGVV